MKSTGEKDLVLSFEQGEHHGGRIQFFSDCIHKALDIIKNHIEEDQSITKKQSIYHQVDQCNIRINRDQWEKSNIIALIGGRGTGKTTVLEELIFMLKNCSKRKYDNELENRYPQNENEIQIAKLGEKAIFHTLPMLDVSLLEEQEDMLELVLAELLEKVERKLQSSNQWSFQGENSYKKQEFAELLGEVYRNHHNIKHSVDEFELEEVVISKLHNMPSRKKVLESFSRLLESYFQTWDMCNGRMNYLVLGIDDLDLNLKHGFKMLEELYKYLTHPRVIILAALDIEQLTMISEAYYRSGMEIISYDVEEKKWIANHCRELATNYLMKLIPTERRVYLPNIIGTAKLIYAKLSEEEDGIKLKAFLMHKMAEKMHIYYDGNGRKHHFIIPDTVRGIDAYFSYLEELNTVDFSKCEILKGVEKSTEEDYENQKRLLYLYDQNYEWLAKDIQKRMFYEKNPPQARELLKKLERVDLGRRASYAIEFKEKWLNGLPLKAETEDEIYRYGDFLECIYSWGRQKYEDKPIIHCILASFTNEMVREYLNYMYHPDETQRVLSRHNLMNFIGRGFGNNWIKMMLPVRMEKQILLNADRPVIRHLAFATKSELQMVQFPFVMKGLLDLENMYLSNLPISENMVESVILKMAEQLEAKKFIKVLECMDMLFVNCRMKDQEKPHVSFDFEFRKDSLSTIGDMVEINCKFNTEQADFDIFGFILRSINTKEENMVVCREIAEALSEAFIKFVGEKKLEKYRKKIEDLLKKKLEEQSMFFGDVSEDIAFPFFDVDMSYNIIKRVQKQCRDSFLNPINEMDLLKTIYKIYEYIEEQLKQEEKFYSSEKNPKICCTYRKAFSRYPYIKIIKQISTQSEYQKMFRDVIMTTLSLETIQWDDESMLELEP